ncbi:MAG TPA: hypothetical protein DHW45_19120 [Candidatus Latescibacteria bacterium]|jgi:sialate O-acetylesterase|nr:hypothetical protein [Candidatus Latescibacterota bacterium]
MGQPIRKISKRFRTYSLITVLGLVGFAPVASADVAPNALFEDHAVLQQGISIPVWVTADAGDAIPRSHSIA